MRARFPQTLPAEYQAGGVSRIMTIHGALIRISVNPVSMY